jgi:hypothetical protein
VVNCKFLNASQQIEVLIMPFFQPQRCFASLSMSWNEALYCSFYIGEWDRSKNKGTIKPASRATDHALRPKASATRKTGIA